MAPFNLPDKYAPCAMVMNDRADVALSFPSESVPSIDKSPDVGWKATGDLGSTPSLDGSATTSSVNIPYEPMASPDKVPSSPGLLLKDGGDFNSVLISIKCGIEIKVSIMTDTMATLRFNLRGVCLESTRDCCTRMAFEECTRMIIAGAPHVLVQLHGLLGVEAVEVIKPLITKASLLSVTAAFYRPDVYSEQIWEHFLLRKRPLTIPSDTFNYTLQDRKFFQAAGSESIHVTCRCVVCPYERRYHKTLCLMNETWLPEVVKRDDLKSVRIDCWTPVTARDCRNAIQQLLTRRATKDIQFVVGTKTLDLRVLLRTQGEEKIIGDEHQRFDSLSVSYTLDGMRVELSTRKNRTSSIIVQIKVEPGEVQRCQYFSYGSS